MAYEVTATRRRPQRFEDLIGQEFVAETLRNSIQSGKIAHAYLFSGPRGCGKTSTARILAKALNCEKGPTANPCGECSCCTEITKGSSLDVIEIDGASNTSVNDVRQIKDEVLFPPNSCRYKIYIIDEVHMLSTSAFNALLKTIEEPPPYVIFIFATTELQKVPATIKSRCQQFNFRLVPIEKVKEQLAKAAEEIGVKAEEEALYWIARESGGSMRDSYTLFDQVAAFSDGEITYDKIRDKLGLVGVDRLNEMFTLCSSGDVTTALLKIDEYLQNGISIEQLITNCTDYLRSLLFIKSGVTKEALLGQAADRYAKEVLAAWNNIQIERALSIFLQLYRDIRYSLSPRYELELAVSRLCWLKDYVSSAEVKKAVDAVKPLLMRNAGAGQQMPSGSQQMQAPVQQNGFAQQNGSVMQNRPAQPSQSPQRQAYVPHFGALDEAQNAQGDQSHPFLNGGAVPPVNNTAASGSVFSNTDYSADSYDAEEGSYAPDDSYEEMSESEKIAAQESYYANADIDDNEAILGSSDTGAVPSGQTFAEEVNSSDPMTSLRAKVCAELQASDDTLIASALNSSRDWKRTDSVISVTANSQFEKMQLQTASAKINALLSKHCNAQVSINVSVEDTTKKTEVKDLPPEVILLRDTFKGTVII